MAVVASKTSPLNCRWIRWDGNLPVCTRPPAPPHGVTEGECSYCDFWEDDARPSGRVSARVSNTPLTAGHMEPDAETPASPLVVADPLNRETCPRCGTRDVVLTRRDAIVQSFACAICHQRWLATRPWPVLHETRSHGSGT